MSDNRKLDVSGIFIVAAIEFQAIDNLSLVALGYQLWSLATSQLVGDNREFDVSCIF